jgi:TetR/AcrR family transcriptional regulator, transcriptional repressor for nem operon
MSSSTKTELLHEASRMLLSKGLKGFSLQELAAKLHLKKASLFHHFPSKLALAVELYQFYQESFRKWTDQHAHLSPERQIILYAEELTRWICEKQRVCPVGALSLEWHLVDKELQDQITTLHTLQREWLTDLFKKIQKQSGLKISLNEAVLGTMSLLQGSIQLARMLDDPTLVKKNLRSYLKTMKE